MDTTNNWLREWWPVVLLVVVFGGLYLFLRTRTSQLNTWAEFEAQFAAGRPVLIEIYGNT